MKRGARGLAVILAVIMVIALLPMSVSAASGKPGKVKITKFKVAKVSAVTNTTTVTIKWKKAKNAKGYEVFEFNNQTNKWERIKKLGRFYRGIRIYRESAGQRAYKVRAVNGKKKGSFSKKKSKFIKSPLTLEKFYRNNADPVDVKVGNITGTVRGNNVKYVYEMTDAEFISNDVSAIAADTDKQSARYINMIKTAKLDAGIAGVTVTVTYMYNGAVVYTKTFK